jgi:hypothetical protein
MRNAIASPAVSAAPLCTWTRESHCRTEGEECAGQQFRQEHEGKGHAPQPRPTLLPAPDFGGAPRTERLLEGIVDEMDLQPRRFEQLRQRSVLRDLGAKRTDAAAALDQALAHQHALALREGDAERIRGIFPTRLIGVEEGAFELGPEIRRPRRDRHGADDAGIVPPARQ